MDKYPKSWPIHSTSH